MTAWPEIDAVIAGESDGCIVCADSRRVMRALWRQYRKPLFHAIVTDPPAGIGFMGKTWDSDHDGRDRWIRRFSVVAALALRLVPPGGHTLVWALPRTSHWTATAWEDGGWEVRDRVSHLFGTGFPKSLDVGKAIDAAAGVDRAVLGANPNAGRSVVLSYKHDGRKNPKPLGDAPLSAPATPEAALWDGWGTALKPAMEDWWLLRKPLDGTVAQNVLKYGTGALNIDGCRIGVDASVDDMMRSVSRKPRVSPTWEDGSGFKNEANPRTGVSPAGRWPAHVTHDGSDEVLAGFPESVSKPHLHDHKRDTKVYGGGKGLGVRAEMSQYDDSGSAARFFYCAKASKTERGPGNTHPTVKSVALMEWLIRLITPPGGIVCDMFCGSGSTLVAASNLGLRYVGVEREPEYAAIAKARLTEPTPPPEQAQLFGGAE